MKYIKTFLRTLNFTRICKELWSVIIFDFKSLWMLLPVLTVNILFSGNRQQQHMSTQIFLRRASWGVFVDIIRQLKQHITLWNDTNFFIIRYHYKWEWNVKTISSTITWHLGLSGSNNFGEYTSFSLFTFARPAQVPCRDLFQWQLACNCWLLLDYPTNSYCIEEL